MPILNRPLIMLAMPTLIGLSFTTSHAQISVYHTEAAFVSATGQNTAIDFEEADPRGPNGNPPGFFTATDSVGQFQRDILFSVSPGDTSQSAYGIANINDKDYYNTVFGTPYNLGSGDFVSVFAPDHTTPVTLDLALSNSELHVPDIYSVGFLVSDFDGNGDLLISATDASNNAISESIHVPNGSYAFIGFSDTSVLNNLQITGDTGNPTPGFTFDHVLYSTQRAAVPAPNSTLTLLLGGVPGMMMLLGRRRERLSTSKCL